LSSGFWVFAERRAERRGREWRGWAFGLFGVGGGFIREPRSLNGSPTEDG